MKPLCLIWILACGCTTVIAGEPGFDSVAGTGAPENNGDAGPASTINIGEPFGVEITQVPVRSDRLVELIQSGRFA